MEQNQAIYSTIQTQYLINYKGQLVEHLVRVGTSNCQAFIDQLTMVINLDGLNLYPSAVFSEVVAYKEEEYLNELRYAMGYLSEKLLSIFGFGISYQKETGKFGYKYSYQLGTKEVNYGTVAVGGNNNTVCIAITGTGILSAREGWEKELYCFANKVGVGYFKFSRVDIAKDFFDGEYNIDNMLNDYYQGKYKIKHAMANPLLDKVGHDWHNPTLKGRTIYIGSRKSSRYLRGYERGKKLGDVNSRWFRVELELKARDLVIPFDILLRCGDYLTMYPAMAENAHFLDITPEKIPNKQKLKNTHMKLAFAHVKKYLLQQSSRAINLLFMLKWSDKQICDLFRKNIGNGRNTIDFVPRILNLGNFSADKLMDILQYKAGVYGTARHDIYYTTTNINRVKV